jgi:tetratricopeptide (TPR) repeat protein
MQYGRAFAGAGLYDQAAEAYKLAIGLRPDAAEYHLALGLAYDRLGEYHEALDALERAVRLGPNLSEAKAEYLRVTAELSGLECDLGAVEGFDRLMNVGHAYRLKGWYVKAVAVYTLAARQRPRDAQARYYLGLAYYSMNQYYRALESYKMALTIDPKMFEARRDLAWLTAYVSSGERGDKVRRKPARTTPAKDDARVAVKAGEAEKRIGVGAVRPK